MISNHFSEAELSCQCGCGQCIVDVPLIGVLEFIRARFMRPVTVHSGNRCAKHNKEVGGAEQSYHLVGKAADISVKDIDVDSLARAAEQALANGIIIYRSQGFVHVDVRPTHYRAEA